MVLCFRGDKFAFANTGELREDNDIKQEIIAKMLNISQSTYSHYERGYTEIPTWVLIELSKFYNTSTDYLLRFD